MTSDPKFDALGPSDLSHRWASTHVDMPPWLPAHVDQSVRTLGLGSFSHSVGWLCTGSFSSPCFSRQFRVVLFFRAQLRGPPARRGTAVEKVGKRGKVLGDVCMNITEIQ